MRICPLLVFLLTGCFAHESRGDAAARRGNWRAALSEYDAAMEWDLDSPALRLKRYEARSRLAEAALVRAAACWSVQDWKGASAELDAALSVAPYSHQAQQLALLVAQAQTQALPRTDAELAAAVDEVTDFALRSASPKESRRLLELVVAVDDTKLPLLAAVLRGRAPPGGNRVGVR